MKAEGEAESCQCVLSFFVRRIDANSLSQMGITNAEHVEKLFGAVNDLKGRGIRGSPSPGSLDPDQMVKDFIDDMEVEKQKQAATVR